MTTMTNQTGPKSKQLRSLAKNLGIPYSRLCKEDQRTQVNVFKAERSIGVDALVSLFLKWQP
jgi:hypothetical protein